MKIVINGDFGSFGYGVSSMYKDMVRSHSDDRTNSELTLFVEDRPSLCGDLKVVTIPDCATDWEIHDYDGLESVIYVVDGKIYWAS